MDYKHTQIGYLILGVLLFTALFFLGVYIMASTEPQSVNSGTNFVVTVTIVLILFILASFWSLQVIINKNYLKIKFGYGIFKKSFSLKEIKSVQVVKNHWYYGWGIRLFLWPKMWIYNVSGYGAVEITMKDGKRYRIGTDEPIKLEQALKKSIKK